MESCKETKCKDINILDSYVKRGKCETKGSRRYLSMIDSINCWIREGKINLPKNGDVIGYEDKDQKIELTENKDGSVTIKVTDPDGTVSEVTTQVNNKGQVVEVGEKEDSYLITVTETDGATSNINIPKDTVKTNDTGFSINGTPIKFSSPDNSILTEVIELDNGTIEVRQKLNCEVVLGCIPEVVGHTSVPNITVVTDGVFNTKVVNTCTGELGRIVLKDFENIVVDTIEGDINNPLSSWESINGNNLQNHVTGTMNDFNIDYFALAEKSIIPMQSGDYTIESYILCDGKWSTNSNNTTTTCLPDVPLFFTELVPIGESVSTITDYRGDTNAEDVGIELYKEYNFIIGKNITGKLTSEQPLGSFTNNEGLLTLNTFSNSFGHTNPEAVLLDNVKSPFKMSFDKPLNCFGFKANDLDVDNEQLLDFNVNGTGVDNIEVLAGGYDNTQTYSDGTLKNLVADTLNSSFNLFFNKDTSFDEINFNILKNIRYSIGINKFYDCNVCK